MLNPFSLPVMGASLLGAVVVGLHLGQSSIGLINPIYFQAPPLHPRERGAAIDESALGSREPAYAELYGWEQGYAARAADCGDCEALRARDAHAYSARVPYFGSRTGLHRAVAAAPDEIVVHYAEAAEDASPRFADVERYAHYPVSRETVAPEPEPAAEPAVPAAEDEGKKGAARSF
jgi:hypothetical protein